MLRSELKSSAWRRLSTWLDISCTKPSWIIFSLWRGVVVQTLVLLTHPGYGIPLELIRLPGQRGNGSIDSRLLQLGIDWAKECDARELFYSASENFSEEERIRDLGFCQWRELHCYESADHVISSLNGYRTVEARLFSRTEIISLIEQTSESCDDSQTKYFQHSIGSFADAKLTLETMELAPHDPSWWLIALSPDDKKVGLILPVLNYGELTIGFMGVVPTFRGRGLASYLLKQLFPMINRSGYLTIFAEVDQRNRSMQRALSKSGFRLACRKREWRLNI
jgi:RimJ/RimL family protein N-acetyltransferase